MLPGKIPPEILKSIVLSKLGRIDPDVLLGPGLGEDAAVIKIGDQVIVAATDPITGSVEDVGWLAVHVNANDIATFGISPRWFLATILLPVGYESDELEKIMHQIDKAAKKLNISITGGHSEVTENVKQPIVVGFMLGVAPLGEYVTSSGAKPGDSLIVTKTIGIEGTSILANEGIEYLTKKLGDDIIREAQQLRDQISVVKDGVTAFQTGFVSAMHDPTEGGLSGAIHELCDASGVGFEIENEHIPMTDATRLICDTLQINPLELISSGCMLISCGSENANRVLNELESVGVSAVIIGSIVSDSSHRKIRVDGNWADLPRPTTDALWSALKKVNPS